MNGERVEDMTNERLLNELSTPWRGHADDKLRLAEMKIKADARAELLRRLKAREKKGNDGN